MRHSTLLTARHQKPSPAFQIINEKNIFHLDVRKGSCVEICIAQDRMFFSWRSKETPWSVLRQNLVTNKHQTRSRWRGDMVVAARGEMSSSFLFPKRRIISQRLSVVVSCRIVQFSGLCVINIVLLGTEPGTAQHSNTPQVTLNNSELELGGRAE